MGNEQTAEKAAGNSAGNDKAAAVKGAGAAKAGDGKKAGAPAAPKLTPEALKKIAQMRDRLQGLLGQVVMALSVVPRYRHQTLADLHHLVVEPLMRDRIAIASLLAHDADPPDEPAGISAGADQRSGARSGAEGTEGASPPGARRTATVSRPVGAALANGEEQPRETDSTNFRQVEQVSAIAFWASVSDAVDAKIREQVKAGAFPIRLKPEEWASGDTVWLLDVIAPSQKLATAVLANFSKVLPKKDGGKSGQVRIHPIVARQVDPELLKKMGAVAEGA